MNVWSKLMTALRGGANEASEAIVEAQALRILDQEVRDASEEVKASRDSLAEMMAREKVSEQKCSSFNSKIAEFEDYAIQALQKNDESLAQDLAEKIADLENQLNIEQNAHDGYASSAESLRNAIKQADSNIKRLKHQVETVRATENVQR
ncbi:MAG: PspA/IM30 family protein, partial [Thiotrichaceae bacterium]|nr:PspA/IM30 family protein [Thiotrichaceae bacterium]